jgi:hypothetical protein
MFDGLKFLLVGSYMPKFDSLKDALMLWQDINTPLPLINRDRPKGMHGGLALTNI